MPLSLFQRLGFYLSYIDFFSSKICFKYRNKDSFSTMIGGILSIFIFFIAILLTAANQALWQTHVTYTETDQLANNISVTINGLTNPLFVDFVDPNNHSLVVNMYKNFTVGFYCGAQANNINWNINPLSSTSCSNNAQFCYPQNQLGSCLMSSNYMKGSKSGILVNISVCNSSVAGCDWSLINKIYPGGYVKLRIRYKQAHLNDKSELFKTIDSRILTFNMSNITNYVSYYTKYAYYEQSNINLFSWSDNLIQKGVYIDPRDTILNFTRTYLRPTPLVRFKYFIFASTRKIVILEKTKVDVVAIIIYFTSILGTFAFLANIFMPNYTANSLNLKIGSKLKYYMKSNGLLYNPDNFSLPTFFICFTYVKVFEGFWLWLLRKINWQNGLRIIAFIKAGDKCMNVTNFINKMSKINSRKNFKNVVVKARLKTKPQRQIEDYQQSYNKIQKQLDERNMTDQQKNTFLKLTQINSLQSKQAFKMLDALFPKNGLVDLVNPGLKNLFVQFKQIMDILKTNQKANQQDFNQFKDSLINIKNNSKNDIIYESYDLDEHIVQIGQGTLDKIKTTTQLTRQTQKQKQPQKQKKLQQQIMKNNQNLLIIKQDQNDIIMLQ